jgi:NAD(P)-dependent dehydrogenase (short-subunit alcohol dehydrogenase family)
VVLFARRKSELDDVAGEIRAAGGVADAIVGDAQDPRDCASAVANAAAPGRVDALVNCVGMNIPGRALTDLTATAWSEMLAANLDVAYHLTQAALPVFRRQGDGLLVHISSKSALAPDASGASYQAAKAGVAALAHATAVEELANGVRVSVVYPGMTDTPLVLARPRPPSPDELARALQPADVAAVVQMLLDLPARAYVPDVSIYPTH